MTTITVHDEQLPIRSELADEVEEAWRRLAQPGTWWNGSERLAIVRETRHSLTCRYCQQRKDALSPYTVAGSHEVNATQLGTGPSGKELADERLSDAAIEAIHRLRTDAGRVTASWITEVTSSDLSEEAYVELVGIVATVTALDTFDVALGRELRTMPQPAPGSPSRHRPRGAARDLAWVTTVAPDKYGDDDVNPYLVHGDKNIHRALSLVPQAVMDFFDLDVELYLKDHQIRDFATEYRSINHAQIELIAGRASALNGCFY